MLLVDGGSAAAVAGANKPGGGAGATIVGRQDLAKGNYTVGIGYGGSIYTENLVKKPHGGGDTYIKNSSGAFVVKANGGAGGGTAGGGGGAIENSTAITYSDPYNLSSNGASGTSDGLLKQHAIGAPAFRTIGIGRNRGAGGTNHFITNSGEDTSGDGGALYILTTKEYCMFKLTANDGAYINAVVSNDSYYGDYVINTQAQAGTISGEKSVSFIVKKGATITCTITKNNYNSVTKTFTAGSSLDGNNVHNETVTLKKTIYTRTLALNGATISATGQFTDLDGNVIQTSLSGANSITFNVWIGDNNVHWTASRLYYDTNSGDYAITSSGIDYLPALPKHRYYATLDRTGEWKFKNDTKYVNATWSWNANEISNAPGTTWSVYYEGFEVKDLVKGDTSINYGSVSYNNNLPYRMSIELKNYTKFLFSYTNKTFKIGTVWAEIN